MGVKGLDGHTDSVETLPREAAPGSDFAGIGSTRLLLMAIDLETVAIDAKKDASELASFFVSLAVGRFVWVSQTPCHGW
jgi:hypothetical protein